jgi:hypothetical protein
MFMEALHTAPEELRTDEGVEQLGKYMAEKLGTLEERQLLERKKDDLMTFLERHVRKVDRGERLQLIMRF